MRNIILTTLLTALTIYTYAQKIPIRYGKPSMEEMTKSVYEIDSSAPAIVLCNYGFFNNSQFMFTQTMRIKILKKEGYEWANMTFNTGSLATVRGKTFNLVNGKIVASKLSSKSIYREEVIKNTFFVTKISMPDVKVGSVIDIQVSYPWIPMTWYFQETIPVLYSELLLERNDYIEFNKNSFGYVGFYIIEPGHWVTKNVPAFQKEPFMAPKKNYIAHFEFDVTSLTIPGRLYESYSRTWDDVAETLYKSTTFGGALEGSGSFFKSYAKKINEQCSSDLEKVKAAVDTIHTMHWNGANRLFLSSGAGLKYYFSKGTGNSAEVNLSLIRLLDKLGFEVHPVIMRTRDQGHLSTFKPTISNLNYVVAHVKIDGKPYIVDGTDNFAPYYILPDRCLNEKGLVITKDSTRWVNLSNGAIFRKNALYMLNLNSDDLSLSGDVSYAYKGYAAYHFRKDYSEDGTKENYINRFANSIEGMRVIKDTLMNLEDIYKQVKEKATVEIQDQCFATDSLVFLNILPDRLKENPFKQEKRKYPIDFIYPKEYKTSVIITVPDNYQVVTIPESKRMKLPNNSANFTYIIQQKGNKVLLSYSFKINKSVFSQKDYKFLKSFYQQVIDKEAEPVVFKVL